MKASRKLGRKSLSKMGAKSRNILLAGIFALGGGLILPLSAEAAEAEAAATTTKAEESSASETPAYTMGEVVVTATRTEKREVDVPMATEVITEEDIKESGAKNAAEALQKINGLEYGAFGPIGAAMGTMSNEINIRGVDNGTLVLVNGNPISQRQKIYNLQAISADAIEKIEVVKGGGSILYGSEAMGGVVNIITKTEASNSVSVGFGNYGQQRYHVNAGVDGLMVTYDRQRFGHQEGVTFSDVNLSSSKANNNGDPLGTTRTDDKNILNESATISYKFNENLSFLYGHYRTSGTFYRTVTGMIPGAPNKTGRNLVGEPFNNRTYKTLRDIAQLNYRDKNWKWSLYYNTGTIESEGFTNLTNTTKVAGTTYGWGDSNNPYNTREKNMTYGLDVQRNWDIGKGKLTAGFSGQRELYRALYAHDTSASKRYMRNNWGAYVQWDQKIDAKNEFIIGGRQTWTTAATKNYHNFSGAFQFLHKMDDKNNLFLNVSQSFIMPTFANMYKSGDQQIPSPDLKPQKGINYEFGWKQKSGGHTWKASLFHINIKDNISANYDKTAKTYSFENEDFRNTGLELSYAVECKNGFSYNAGLTWQNPVRRSESKGYWDRKFGKIQLVGGISYKKDKWRASFQGSFLGARVGIDSKLPSFYRKPYFLTTLTVAYAPTDKSEFELTVDNVFDRDDIISNSSSEYHSAPTNFLFSFTQKF